MGYTKDLWTNPERGPDGKVKLGPDGKVKRVPNDRWGKGKRWLACWLDPDKNERTMAFKAKTPADNHWKRQEADVERGEYIDPTAGAVLFGDFGSRWLASRVVDESTKIRYESVYRLHVEPEFGKRAVRNIKPSAAQSFLAGLGERFGTSTVAAARLVLQGILDLALADEAIKKNPVKSPVVQRSKTTGEKIQAWGDNRIFALIDAHPDDLRLLPTLGSSAGLREAELFGVALEDFDFEEKGVHVRRQIKKLGPDYVFALPKNDSERFVPLSDWTLESVKTHIRKYKPRSCTLPWEKRNGSLRTYNILFRWSDGGHLKPRSFSETCWKPALVKAKIIPEPTLDARKRKRYATTRKEGTHQLRHYYASVMLAGGASVVELAEYLGHHSPSFTLEIYGHMLPDSHDRARRIMDDRLFRPRIVAQA